MTNSETVCVRVTQLFRRRDALGEVIVGTIKGTEVYVDYKHARDGIANGEIAVGTLLCGSLAVGGSGRRPGGVRLNNFTVASGADVEYAERIMSATCIP